MSPNPESPVAGDLLILRDQQPGGGYTLAIAPGPSQLRYASYDEALKVAIRWASSTGVSIWRANGDTRFDRVEVHES